jgi:hypothetical protein
MKTSAALMTALAVAFVAFAGAGFAQDPVKTKQSSSENYNRPGRQIDDNILTSGKGFEKSEREIDDGTMPRGKRADALGRDFDQDAQKPGKRLHRPGSHEPEVRKIRKNPLDD